MKESHENAACDRNGCEAGARPTTVEMERVTNGAAAAGGVAKCCGGGGKPPRTFPEPSASSDVCLPKCPAVSPSPWDPIKTWLAVVLSVAMLVWAGLGVYFIEFRKAQ